MPKTYFRDICPFRADFSSGMNDWRFRGLFQYPDGTIQKRLELRGIDEMKRALRQLENGTMKVVRTVGNYNSLRYERIESREEETKEALRKDIKSLENNYAEHEAGEKIMCQIVGDIKQA